MRLVLDFDGTVYDPGTRLKDHVVPYLKNLLRRYVAHKDESFEMCQARLATKHGTQNMFLQLQLECGFPERWLIKETYCKGLDSFNPLFLREGIITLFEECSPVDILSNAPRIWVIHGLDEMNVSQYSGSIYALSEGNLQIKPAPEAYAQVLHTDVVYVEDEYHNCIAAADYGWKTFWFPPLEVEDESADSRITRIRSGLDVFEYI